MSSSSAPFSSATQRRSVRPVNIPTSFPGTLRPPSSSRPISQFLAVGFLVFFASLQFLPATHFRNPSDPSRTWVPFKSSSSSSFSIQRATGSENVELGVVDSRYDKMIHIVSWMDCLDLRMLTILTNSTLSSSSHPEHVYFHFFTPEGHDDKVSYYKLKVLFPHSNMEILGQVEVRNEIMKSYSVGEYSGPAIHDIAPFVISTVHPSLQKFIYVSPNIVMKGRVEELVGVNLSNYGIALAEDCSNKLSTSVNSEVLDALQRSASKPWVSEKPYAKNACMLDLGLVLIDAGKLEDYIIEAILWWGKVLNKSLRSMSQMQGIVAMLNLQVLPERVDHCHAHQL